MLMQMLRDTALMSTPTADGISVEQLLDERFERVSRSGVDHLVVSEVVAAQSFAMLVRKRGQ